MIEVLTHLEEGTVAGVEGGDGECVVQPHQAEDLGLRDPGEQPVELLLAHVCPVQHQGRGLLLHGGGQDVGRDLLSREVNTSPEARVQTDSVPGLTDPDIVAMSNVYQKTEVMIFTWLLWQALRM